MLLYLESSVRVGCVGYVTVSWCHLPDYLELNVYLWYDDATYWDVPIAVCSSGDDSNQGLITMERRVVSSFFTTIPAKCDYNDINMRAPLLNTGQGLLLISLMIWQVGRRDHRILIHSDSEEPAGTRLKHDFESDWLDEDEVPLHAMTATRLR